MNQSQEYFLTEKGIAKLRIELDELKGSKRTELAKRLRTAIQQGDLSENADYSKAKEDQAFLEGRVQEIEVMLKNAVIISEKGSSDGIIGMGSRVTVKEDGRGAVEYLMIGAQESDPRNGKISNESPIGRALIGHHVGDTVEVETPSGKLSFKIEKVE